MLSVNTNAGAMVALQNLNGTVGQMSTHPGRHQHGLEGCDREGQWCGLRHRAEHARRRGRLFRR